ncbi:MAG: EAL domain-containing protein [Pseudomonadota bacterium]
MLECIRRAQQQYIDALDAPALFNQLLNNFLQLTESGFGFVGDILHDENAAPFLKTRALSNIAWNKVTRTLYERHAPQGMEFRKLDSLFGAVITSGSAVIANDPRHDPRRGGTPKGHPAMENFLGLPLWCDGRLIGMVGLANREGGYHQALIDYLTPLLETTATLIQAYHGQVKRGAAANGLLETQASLQEQLAAQTRELRGGNKKLRKEVKERQRLEAALRDVATAVSASTGDQFHRSLVEALTRVLRVDMAFISVMTGERTQAEIVTLCDRGAIVSNYHYPLVGTPCQDVLEGRPNYFPSELRRHFPDCPLAAQFGLESFLAVPFFDTGGQPLGLVAIARRKALSEPQPAEAILQIFAARIAAELIHQRDNQKNRKLSLALEQTADAVMITDRDGVIEYTNPAFTAMTGIAANTALGNTPSIVKSGKHDVAFYRNMWAVLLADQPFRDILINRKKNGELYYEEKTITPLKGADGEITHYISTGKDITERMQTQERLHYLAYHDVLTGLPNRQLFMERLEHALALSRTSGRQLAVLCLDVDCFKIINDTLGHEFGDRVLKALAELLSAQTGPGDTVARLSGDEYAVLLENITNDTEVPHKVSAILGALSHALRIDDRELYTTTCIGIALAPADGGDAHTLLRHADTAMYRAKEQGRHCFQFYSADLSATAFKRLDLETKLRRAVEREEFYLRYQPQVDLRSGRVIGAEALLRWQHPERGPVNPMEFIATLEDTGLIVTVGEWVLRQACQQAAGWRDRNGTPLRLSVNVSGRQFQQPNLAASLQTILAEKNLAGHALELEVTESVLMQNDPVTERSLQELQEMGIRLAIDDFGTGYSSLGYLKRFPVDTLKIDRSFIRDVTKDKDDEAIISAVIAMARALELNVVAEGIETAEQLHFLQRHGCDIGQGFLFSQPISGADLHALLDSVFSLR